MSGAERRKFNRVLFTIDDGIIGTLSVAGVGDKKISANIINISEGGVCLTFKPILNQKIKEGDRLLLTEIRSAKSKQLIINVDTEIKWISEGELSDKIGTGCEFVDVISDKKVEINDFVEYWYLQKMEN
jgi:c-di-GMP-binding flagellar brake protein YcgR